MKKREICKRIVKAGGCAGIFQSCNDCPFGKTWECESSRAIANNAKKWLKKHPKKVSQKKYKKVADKLALAIDQYLLLSRENASLKDSRWMREQKPVEEIIKEVKKGYLEDSCNPLSALCIMAKVTEEVVKEYKNHIRDTADDLGI